MALRAAAAVLVLALGACGSDDDGGATVTAGEQPRQVQPGGSDPGPIVCGQPFRPPAPSGIRVTAELPRAVAAGEPMLRGTAQVTSEEAVRGVTSEHADGFLVRDGRVVTTPLPQADIGIPWDTAAGEVREVPVIASTVSCRPAGEPLTAGEYELYVRVTITPDDGEAIQAFGGPSPLRVE